MVMCHSTMRETWVQSQGWEDLLEKEMATHSSIPAWRIPWMEDPDRLQSMGSQRVGHDWVTSLSTLLMRWPKYWSFSFSIIPSKEIPGLITFRMDWLDLHAVQGTLKCLLQGHSSKPSILRCSAFFTVQLSHPYMTTGKTIALTGRTFFGKVTFSVSWKQFSAF